MKAYYERDGVTIYHGDCLDVLPQLPDKIHTIVGDPPYCSGGRQQAGARLNLEKSARNTWFLTDNMGTDSFLWWMREIAGRLFNLAELGAHFYCFTDWRQYSNLVTACETKGWTLRNVVVWDKARGGAMGSFWRNNHEWVPVFTKGPARAIAHGSCFNTWHGTKPQADEHATVKPLGLVSYLLQAAGTGSVLDPWMGSGTTLLAAKTLGCRAIGIEIEEQYCEIAAKRLQGEPVMPMTRADDLHVRKQVFQQRWMAPITMMADVDRLLSTVRGEEQTERWNEAIEAGKANVAKRMAELAGQADRVTQCLEILARLNGLKWEVRA